MSIFDFLGSIFKPAADLVDNIHTSKEEKLKLQNALEEIHAGVQTKIIEMEEKRMALQGQLAEALAKVQIAEAASESWLTRNHRAIIILGIFGLICAECFQLTKLPLPPYFQEIFLSYFGVAALAPGLAKTVGPILDRLKRPK